MSSNQSDPWFVVQQQSPSLLCCYARANKGFQEIFEVCLILAKTAMSSPGAACGQVEVFAVVKASYILTTCFFLIELDIFDAGGPQCHLITSVIIAVRIRTLSAY